jgi:hypothetical protein
MGVERDQAGHEVTVSVAARIGIRRAMALAELRLLAPCALPLTMGRQASGCCILPGGGAILQPPRVGLKPVAAKKPSRPCGEIMKCLPVLCAALTCLLAMSGPGPARGQELPLLLHPFVWEGFEEYAGLRNPSAFAVSRDGSEYGYSFCPERRCKFNTGQKVALDSCEESGGEDCIIFAVKQDIRVPYEVIDLANAQGCPAPSAATPDITVVPEIDEVVHDHSLDIHNLTELDKRGQARQRPVNYEVLGLHIPDFPETPYGNGMSLVKGSGGVTCLGIDGTIRLRMTSTIYVASEFSKSSCLYRETLAHEERHNEVGRRLFEELAAHATRLLRTELQRQPYVRITDAAHAEAVAEAWIDVTISSAFETFWETYGEEQARIDSDEEYARLDRVCADGEE